MSLLFCFVLMFCYYYFCYFTSILFYLRTKTSVPVFYRVIKVWILVLVRVIKSLVRDRFKICNHLFYPQALINGKDECMMLTFSQTNGVKYVSAMFH